jgi:hypothetical protein
LHSYGIVHGVSRRLTTSNDIQEVQISNSIPEGSQGLLQYRLGEETFKDVELETKDQQS